VTRPRAADDFATIRARMDELRREREGAQATGAELAVAQCPKPALAASRAWRRVGTGTPIRFKRQLGREGVCGSGREQPRIKSARVGDEWSAPSYC
jgi:hypothetical protein